MKKPIVAQVSQSTSNPGSEGHHAPGLCQCTLSLSSPAWEARKAAHVFNSWILILCFHSDLTFEHIPIEVPTPLQGHSLPPKR